MKRKQPEPGLSLEDLLKSVGPQKKGDDVIIFCPSAGDSFVEFPLSAPLGAMQEIIQKAAMVQAGIDDFTECEKLALLVIQRHAEYGLYRTYSRKRTKK